MNKKNESDGLTCEVVSLEAWLRYFPQSSTLRDIQVEEFISKGTSMTTFSKGIHGG